MRVGCVIFAACAWGVDSYLVSMTTVSIPNGHTLTKGPTVALGMLSNHADLLHSYCDEEGCICMEHILNLVWTEGVPS